MIAQGAQGRNTQAQRPSEAAADLGGKMGKPHDLLTDAEVVAYLRLDANGGNARERLRNLIRRSGLPVIRRGGLRLFRRSAVDAWLTAGERAPRMPSPARLQAAQRLTATSTVGAQPARNKRATVHTERGRHAT